MDVEVETNGSLDEDETFRCNIQIPIIGLTLTVCVTTGHVIVYGSFSITNPNRAINDFYLEIHVPHESESEICREVFIDNERSSECIHSPITPSSPLHTRSAPSSPDKTVYLSFMGKDDNNSFIMNTTYGNSLNIFSHSTSSPEGILSAIILIS